MNVNDLRDYVTANLGNDSIVTKTDGTEVRGYILSVNSKGLNVKDDDNKTISVAASRVEHIRMADDELTGDGIDDLTDADELDTIDGHTTAELANLFNTSAKALRVHLRAMGMGVGQGRRYHLDNDQLATVKAHFEV